jgi:hypothetical protein
MKMKVSQKVIVVVEPHADDAYLSCHQHIADWKKQEKVVQITTIFSGTRKRGRDGSDYASAMGVEWMGLGYDEFAEEQARNAYVHLPFDPTWGSLQMLYSPSDVLVVGPVGIQNPDHKAVAEWLKGDSTHEYALASYVEIPYYTKHKNEEEVNQLLTGSTIASIKKPKYTKADDKYWKCFKDQAKFFHFNPPESYKDIPEILVFGDD